MRLLLKLGSGVLVRFVGMLAESFAQWLFHEVSEGGDGRESLTDIWEFCRWFVRTLAGQLCGRARRQFDEYEGDFHPGLYGAH